MTNTEVLALYESGFARHYDLRAQVWEQIVCREAMASFQHRLRCLPRQPLQVLDLGCGSGRNLQRLASAGINIDTYTGVDTSSSMIAAAQRRHPYTKATFTLKSAEDALTTDTTYDLIIATWLLSHYPDPAVLVAEATHRLNQTGRFITLCITESKRLRARLHGIRFERFLHANPVKRAQLQHNTITFEHVSAGGLVTLAEYRSERNRCTGPSTRDLSV